MDHLTNPYAPGAGRMPAALVGRDEQRVAWSNGMDRVMAGRDDRSLVLYGLRGVGKTVLLSDLMRSAEGKGWITGFAEAGTGKSLRELLSEALQLPLADLARPDASERVRSALKTFTSFQASVTPEGTWTFGLDLDATHGSHADSGSLDLDLSQIVREVSAAAGENGRGLALLIDEAQDLTSDELTAICSVMHMATQRRWPVLIALAGLPSLPVKLGEAKSYAERLFSYHQVRELSGHHARAAIVDPAAAQDVTWDEDALHTVIDATSGYPYFLQEYGQAAWKAADAASEHITFADARVAHEAALRTLDSGFFRVRWERATPTERDYLKAMAVDGDEGSSSGEVASRLGKKITALGPIRANLISKGLVYAPEHGQIAFTVPRMADFINRQID